jgi:hypothetical protein
MAIKPTGARTTKTLRVNKSAPTVKTQMPKNFGKMVSAAPKKPTKKS